MILVFFITELLMQLCDLCCIWLLQNCQFVVFNPTFQLISSLGTLAKKKLLYIFFHQYFFVVLEVADKPRILLALCVDIWVVWSLWTKWLVFNMHWLDWTEPLPTTCQSGLDLLSYKKQKGKQNKLFKTLKD